MNRVASAPASQYDARMRIRPLIYIAVAAAGCATANHSPALPSPTKFVELTIANGSAADVTLFATHDGFRERVGRVPAAMTTHMMMPERMLGSFGDVQFTLEQPGGPMGSLRAFTTPSVSVHPCQRLEMSLDTQLDHTMVAVYPGRGC